MSWLGIQGHDSIVERFRTALGQNRIASTFLFVGESGIGKRTFAMRLSQCLLCQQSDNASLEPCGECSDCVQVIAESHPDLELVALPEGRSSIPLELLIGDKDHRMRDGLCHRMSMKPVPGGRKIAIIDDADRLNIEGANCLLKTLEEPPPRAIIFLIGSSLQRLLPTIRSRSQVVQFQPLDDSTVARLLLDHGVAVDAAQANELAALAGGSFSRAAIWADSDLREAREELLNTLAKPDWDSVALTKWLSKFVESVGPDTASRRRRVKDLAAAAAAFFQQMVYQACGSPLRGDFVLTRAVQLASANQGLETDRLVDCVQRCIQVPIQIDANANVNTLIAAWLDDIRQLVDGRFVDVG